MEGVVEEAPRACLPLPARVRVGLKLHLVLLAGKGAGRKSGGMSSGKFEKSLEVQSDLRGRCNCVQAGGGHGQLVVLAGAEGGLERVALVKREYIFAILILILIFATGQLHICWNCLLQFQQLCHLPRHLFGDKK